ncbi:MAG TPA: GNAT family N-acetyltransferase [Acidimicrobiales bacterium]|nr:GNAT family N-acetyltransferase [Acidimicrobiales bacterium]
MDPDSQPRVVDLAEESRFVLREGGAEAELVYALEDGRLVLVHTGVPDEMAGRGVGGRLVKVALDRAAREGLRVVPLCPFARRWLRNHPDMAAGVDIDWRLPPGWGRHAGDES